MAVTTTNSRVSYTGDGISTVFQVPFYFLTNPDLKVYVGGDQLSTGYTVTGAGIEDGGSVEITPAPAANAPIVILRDPDTLQQTRLPPNDPFPSSSVEDMVDKLTMIVQRHGDLLGRAPILADSDVDGAGAYRANQNRMQDLGDPVNSQDAVNLRTMQTAIANLLVDGAGDTVLSLLANPTDKTLGVSLVGGAGRVVNSIAELRTLLKTKNPSAFVLSYYGDGKAGGGPFQLDPNDSTSTDNGGTIIVASDGGRWKRVNQSVVNVQDFGARGDNTGDDYAAIVAARDYAWSGLKTLVIPYGVYPHSQKLEFCMGNNFKVHGIGFPTLRFTGTASSVAVSIDAGATSYRYGLEFLDINIEGNSNVTDALYMRALAHSRIRARAWDCTQNACNIVSGVCNDAELRLTSVGGRVGAPNIKPANGLTLNSRVAGDYVAWCTFRNLIAENVTGRGFNIIDATGNLFIGGTSEGNPLGIYVGAASRFNTFQNIDMEANTGNGEGNDITVFGSGNSFIRVQCLSSAATYNVSMQGGDNNSFIGCSLRSVNVQSTSAYTAFHACRFSDNAALGIHGAGTYTTISCVLENNSGVQSAVLDDYSAGVRANRLAVRAASNNTISADIVGLGNTSATSSLRLRNGDGTLLVNVTDDGYFFSPAVYAKTTANGANVFVGSDGSVLRSTSALKYKDVVGPIEDSMIDGVLGLSGFIYTAKGNPEGGRYVGMAADHFDAAGLKEFVFYNEEGEVESLFYERLTVIHNEAIKRLREQNKALEERLIALENPAPVEGAA